MGILRFLILGWVLYISKLGYVLDTTFSCCLHCRPYLWASRRDSFRSIVDLLCRMFSTNHLFTCTLTELPYQFNQVVFSFVVKSGPSLMLGWYLLQEDGLLHTTCGTPNYVAPEVNPSHPASFIYFLVHLYNFHLSWLFVQEAVVLGVRIYSALRIEALVTVSLVQWGIINTSRELSCLVG
jgi:hypothetical protein